MASNEDLLVYFVLSTSYSKVLCTCDDVVRTELDGAEDLGLVIGREVGALCVAAALDVEDALWRPVCT